MSRQSDAKKSMVYNPNPRKQVCATCKNYKSYFIVTETSWGGFSEEKGKHCDIGQFTVKKTANCFLWEPK